MFRYMDQVYAVYQAGSFTKAAKQLCVSQPALSATVKKTEDALGYPIFDRSTKAITLTDIGRQYIDAAEQILLIRENLQHRIDDTQNLRRGSFILAALPLLYPMCCRIPSAPLASGIRILMLKSRWSPPPYCGRSFARARWTLPLTTL